MAERWIACRAKTAGSLVGPNFNWNQCVYQPKRTMSAAARRKIAAAQRARSAKVKSQAKKAA
jgi:hypothetical protein